MRAPHTSKIDTNYAMQFRARQNKCDKTKTWKTRIGFLKYWDHGSFRGRRFDFANGDETKRDFFAMVFYGLVFWLRTVSKRRNLSGFAIVIETLAFGETRIERYLSIRFCDKKNLAMRFRVTLPPRERVRGKCKRKEEHGYAGFALAVCFVGWNARGCIDGESTARYYSMQGFVKTSQKN